MKPAIQKSTSKYLYSDKNLYFQVLEEFNKGNCLFSRNLTAYLENSTSQPGPFYGKHLNECKICQEKVRNYRKLLHTVKSQIPYVQPEHDFLSHIEPELKEAFSVYKKRLKKEEKKNSYFEGKMFAQVGEDILRGVILTPSFLKGLMWTGITTIILSQIL